MTERINIASKKRQLLAVYIDYLLFGAIWTLFPFFTDSAFSTAPYKLITFFILESVLYWRFGSPGLYFLSIQNNGDNYSRNTYNPFRNQLTVDTLVFNYETKLTMLIGILFILAGSKEIFGWTTRLIPVPYFGIELPFYVSGLISIVYGVIYILIGYFVLKLKKSAFSLTLGATVVSTISLITGWNKMTDVLIRGLILERADQGRLLQDEIVEPLTLFIQATIILIIVLMMLSLTLIKKRLRY